MGVERYTNRKPQQEWTMAIHTSTPQIRFWQTTICHTHYTLPNGFLVNKIIKRNPQEIVAELAARLNVMYRSQSYAGYNRPQPATINPTEAV